MRTGACAPGLLLLALNACTPRPGTPSLADSPPPSVPALVVADAEPAPIPNTGPWDRAAIITHALRSVPGVLAADARSRAARARPGQALAWPDPRLTVERLQLGSSRQRPVIEFMQRIPWPGTRDLRGRTAQAEASAVEQEAAAVRVALVRSLDALYHQLAAAEERQRLAEAAVDLLVTGRASLGRTVAGGADQQPLIGLESNLARRRSQSESLAALAAQLRLRIRTLAVLPEDAVILVAALEQPPLAPEAAVLGQTVEERNRDLLALRERVAAAGERLALSQREIWPEPTVALMYDTGMMADERWMAAVSITLPLGRGARSAAVAEAEERRLAADLSLADRAARLRAEAEAVRYLLEDAARRETLATDHLIPDAERTLALERSFYRVGAAGFAGLTERELALIGAREAAIEARLVGLLAAVDLAALLGGGLQ